MVKSITFMALNKNFFALSSVATVVLGCPSALGEAAPTAERPLSRKEVAALYEGKSWLWSDGIGYFGPKGKFIASAGSGNNRVTVSGEWVASDGGKLCFAGTWKAKSGRRFERICLLHKTKDGQVYQRRLPEGEWYVFRHDPEKAGDQKLVTGDRTR
jgi:hypothetical protein